MTRARVFEILLERYGNSATVISDGKTQSVRAVIQPLNYKNKLYPMETYLPAGYFDNSHYLYFGAASQRLDGEDVVVQSKGKWYQIKRTQKVYLGDEELYQWAVLQECEGGDADV